MKSEIAGLRILGLIGSGGEADVYEVLNPVDGQHYALKRLRAEATEASRFAHLRVELIRHPCLLHPVGRRRTPDGRLEELVPLVRRVDAHSIVRAGGHTVTLSLLIQAVSGLATLHGAGFVHRDIKPDNILVEPTGLSGPWNGHRLLIGDLGMATPLEALNPADGLSGTLGYLAPETLAGNGHSCQSDQFSLGAWLYWAITGRHLLQEADATATIAKTQRFGGGALLEFPDRRFSTQFWRSLLTRLLDPEPANRYPSTSALLAHLLEEAQETGPEQEGLLDLVWNPLALLDEEAATLIRHGAIGSSSEHPLVTLIRFGRPLISREASRALLCFRESWAPDLLHITSASDLLDMARKMDQTRPQTVILDIPDEGGPQSVEGIGLILERFLLQDSPTKSLYVIEGGCSDSARMGSRLSSLAASSVEYLDSGVTSEDSGQAWVSRLFSCLPIHFSLFDELRTLGITGASRIYRVLECSVRTRSIQVQEGKLRLNLEQIAAVRDAAKSGDFAYGGELSEYARTILDVLETLPNGLPHALLSEARTSLPGFDRAYRELISAGSIVTDTTEGAIVASVSPRVLFSRLGETGPAVCKLATDFRRCCRKAGLALDEGSEVALVLRSAVTSHHNTRTRAFALARSLIRRCAFRPALNLLEAARRSGKESPDDPLAGRMWGLRGKALAQLGEFGLTATAWEAARISFRGQGKPLMAARAAFERERQQMSLRAGFTKPAREEISGVVSIRGRRFKLFLEAEELHVRGMLGGFASLESEHWRLLEDGDADERVRAAALIALARAAVDSNQTRLALELADKAMGWARISGEADIQVRILSFLARLEQSRGNLASASASIAECSRLLGEARWSHRFAVRSHIGAVAYEQGRIHDVIAAELENLSEAILGAHLRLEISARRNLTLAYLEAGRPGAAAGVLSTVDGLVGQSFGLPSSGTRMVELESARHLLILEVGQPDEVLAYRAEDSSTDAGVGGLNRIILRRHTAIAKARTGDREGAIADFEHATAAFRAAGAIDELLETEVFMHQIRHPEMADDRRAERLREIEREATDRGLGRIARGTRLVRIELGEGLEPSVRAEMARELRVEADSMGFRRLSLDAAYEEIRARIELGDAIGAADGHREAMERLKAISDGLRDYPQYREAYFRDPRRQRFLELGRRLADIA